MHIHCLGLNYRTADVSLRERLAFPEEKAKMALSRLGCGRGAFSEASPAEGALTPNEMVILSTCNRIEFYAVTSGPDLNPLERYFIDTQQIPFNEIAGRLYQYSGQEAISHLFQVAAGLDSLVLGEPQILGQVMGAFELARSQGAAGPVLTRLFQAALHTGKRARGETTISQDSASISSMAVRMAEQVLPHLADAQIGIVGAGEMAELAVEAFRKRGAARIRVINRTLERARQLAERWGGQADTFENLPGILKDLDILITSTGAPHTILHPEMVAAAMERPLSKPLVIIDIAIPRDVDIEVGQIPGVRLYDLDGLQAHLERSLVRRAQEVPQVEAIIAEELAGFKDYLRALEVTPLISEMRQHAEEIRQAELEKTLRRLPDLTPDERKRLEALTEALVKKILQAPISRLKAEAGSPLAIEYASILRDLFGLKSTVHLNSSANPQSPISDL